MSTLERVEEVIREKVFRNLNQVRTACGTTQLWLLLCPRSAGYSLSMVVLLGTRVQQAPYVVRQENRGWSTDAKGVLHIYQDVHVPSSFYARMLLGRHRAVLATIQKQATRELERIWKCPINLKLHVSVRRTMKAEE